ncbi:MAG: type II secretion system protein [Candidatus Niyogibacteria bacterium]|nr:type II secretion system protein [Candidatus Niyogibacteria bacterium]
MHFLNKKQRNKGLSIRHFFSCKSGAGFSLLEMIAVIGIVGLLSVIGFASLSSARQRADLRDAEAIVLHSLERARSRAAAGIGEGMNHGVEIDSNQVTSFEEDIDSGSQNPASPVLLPATVNTSIDTANPDIIFNRLSGMANQEINITLTHANGNAETITVYEDGAIASN